MRSLAISAGAALLAVAPMASAGIITVNCMGGGDYLDLPPAVLAAGRDDTVLVAPCTHLVTTSAGYPIALHYESPAIVSEEGAQVTILQGDYTTSAFRIDPTALTVRIHIEGFTIRNVDQPIIQNPDAYATLHITDNIIEDNLFGLDLTLRGGSYGPVVRNTIRNNGSSGIVTWHSPTIIEGNEICYNQGHGIERMCCERPLISANEIHHNTGCGIGPGAHFLIVGNHVHHNGSDGISGGFDGIMRDNISEHNAGAGGSCWGDENTFVESNIFRDNEIGFIVSGGPGMLLYCNDICDNTELQLQCTYTTGDPFELDATMNWWGTTDPDQIPAGIWDHNDDPSVVCTVLFDPWCVESGCPPCPVECTSWGTIKSMFR